MENKERLISISNEGRQFYIHFFGTTHYDEDQYGRPIERENFEYLDDHFNKFVLNGDPDTMKEFQSKIAERTGKWCFVGPHSPEIETVDGKYVPNTKSNTYGLWEKASKEDLKNYYRILEQQNKERMHSRLYK